MVQFYQWKWSKYTFVVRCLVRAEPEVASTAAAAAAAAAAPPLHSSRTCILSLLAPVASCTLDSTLEAFLSRLLPSLAPAPLRRPADRNKTTKSILSGTRPPVQLGNCAS
ncbi:hypothetical protein JYU34_005887 [Plutella xylostella]|uniref:Secreted protein n=1 Tax=Plutella xylostella TaxID=51655 RepID=A0ABQ7QUE3_PLUXY|nr:hypothetical protein JYU34_005887 [Plutella xylostella]